MPGPVTQVSLDLTTIAEALELARGARRAGVEWIIVHTGFDERPYVRGVSPLDDLDAVVAVDLAGAGGRRAVDRAGPGDGPAAGRSVVIGAPLAIQASGGDRMNWMIPRLKVREELAG